MNSKKVINEHCFTGVYHGSSASMEPIHGVCQNPGLSPGHMDMFLTMFSPYCAIINWHVFLGFKAVQSAVTAAAAEGCVPLFSVRCHVDAASHHQDLAMSTFRLSAQMGTSRLSCFKRTSLAIVLTEISVHMP